MTHGSKQNPPIKPTARVDRFLREVASSGPLARTTARGKLLFALDATASREATWREACRIQCEMFNEAAAHGGLEIGLCYYRGFNEFTAFPWLHDGAALEQRMRGVTCLGGHTQILRILTHARDTHRREHIDALVFVGDCMEENTDALCQMAGELGLLGVRAFIFQEGDDPVAHGAFAQIARLTGGAHLSFDAGSARILADLLAAVAVYCAGGQRALEDFGKQRGGAIATLCARLGKS